MTRQFLKLHQKMHALEEAKIWSRWNANTSPTAAVGQTQHPGSGAPAAGAPYSSRVLAYRDATITCINLLAIAGAFYASDYNLPVPLLSA